jgi:quercetin dioxygenase-like cupin family protein
MQTQGKLYTLEHDAAQAIWFFGSLTWIKATGEQTNGSYMLLEHLIAPGLTSPYHVHHAEDETFYVIEGQIMIYCGEERILLGPGGLAYGPRDIPHGFRVVGDKPARILLMNNPSGFERFVSELSVPATDINHPPTEPIDFKNAMAVARKYQIDILGPLPK